MPHKFKPILAELPPAEDIKASDVLDALERGGCNLVCIIGPTASGKTGYAVRLARELNTLCGRPLCEIISADSRQVYRKMDIGTGKDLCEYGDIPYHLIDILDAGQQYNVHQFQSDFLEAFDAVRSRGGIPILCGGTGLYVTAVTSSYDFQQRIPLSESKAPSASVKAFFIGTLVTREVRNERIDARLDARLAEGMVDEIRGLLADGVPAETLISYGLEYKFVTLFLLGELSFDEMRTKLAIAIHQFAKRQMTWFRGMERAGIKIHWVNV